MSYPEVKLLINGQWRNGGDGVRGDVSNPASGDIIGRFAHANRADLDEALLAAQAGFKAWQAISVFERSKIMRKAAGLMRERSEAIATLITVEEGKPLAEARMEVNGAADLVDWFAEEARRTYGRVIPSRASNVTQQAIRVPVGPAIGFTPWNFPVSQILRKIAPALAAGCSMLIKGPEETPAAPAAMFACFVDAGVPAGTLQLVYGVPSEISAHCIPNPIIRKVSFTGSVPVGKHLAALAGQHMKPATMELGGHAPVIICNDADLEAACAALIAFKFRNAGQVCISPTRFLVQDGVHDRFVEMFRDAAAYLKVGDGLDPSTQVGPLINERRLQAVERLVDDAVAKGARVETGGARLDRPGHFYAPTVLSNVSSDMAIMNEEPFGPVALFIRFHHLDEAISEANRLPFGLASYAWTRRQADIHALTQGVEAGMLTINHLGLALPETPYGGIKDSGHGSEGGSEALDGYLHTHFVSCLHA
ncbi:NAD-dependent succinate-semialdehyde dehydrogenase [Pseudomonas putida]|uniref:NAD-dependent succinate-semialdehyde dehydrogenase n=1 Tax=Pseudomonas putida TaxID=303 RepID=UPI0023646795|nr:NAD-dependent succinate-semialdehyde dehydrogenase [Pseudomonas putida]MDD2146776.1 NAD-dependent succinate-semialdehyde dehydrogenase [Pseudomonas putida]HDS1705575.1 NAD-dependent succinate-semialdehyde dehydrogenase [Pseudomonas putida]